MLLELYDLHRCLREAGIIVGLTDNRIQRYPNRPALEVRLDLDGNVTSANLLPRDRLEAIRKFECSTGGSRESAPGFNVDPLYRVNPKADVREVNKDFKELGKKLKDVESSLDDRRKAVDELRARCEPNWDCSIKSKINLCLSKAAHELREQLADATNPYIAPLTELLRRSEKLEAKCLHEQVAGRLVDALVSGETGFSIDSYLKILFNEPLSMVLELGEDNCYGGLPANHEAVWYAVNEHLVAKNVRRESNPAKTQRSNQRDGRIGVFGEVIAGQLGKMPERNLPRLGKVKLFSLANIPCQARYGLIESEACPAEPEIQGQLAAALQWVTESDRKDKTWTDVSNSCGYNQAAVLVAYASKMPPVPAALTGFFASEAIDDDIGNAARTEGRFESRTASLVQTLRGMLLEDPGMTVSVMVIAKADAARKKLLLSRQLNG
ncbi:MAG TPA: hypothetical protein VF590_26970, partial [Isosphaeraceae bacterium]